MGGCESGLVFEPEPWHNHASCLVELPDGDLLVCWYHGSGERDADDVVIEGARRRAGDGRWSSRFVLADTPGYPDCNPCMFLDRKGRLHLVYATILANEWHTALPKHHVTSRFPDGPVLSWESSEVLHVTPGEEFVSALRSAACPPEFLAERCRRAADKLSRRLGWMPRAHATVLDDGRIVLPLYSDGFDFSLMALSDDDGLTWRVSAPLVSVGGIQPSVVSRQDGVLVAYMRDNGPPPNRVKWAASHDRGETWSAVEDTDIANPGSGLEVGALRSGSWLMVCNDTESGRHRLAAMLSDDEGGTWEFGRYLEDDQPGSSSYSYPSVIQSRDGSIHVTYSYNRRPHSAAIKWVHFNEEWLRG